METQMTKQLPLTIEEARIWLDKNSPDGKFNSLMSDMEERVKNTFPELSTRAKTWEEILKKRRKVFCINTLSKIKDDAYDYSDGYSDLRFFENSLPSRQSCERELARMQWILIADEYNEGWQPDWKSFEESKWYAYADENKVIAFGEVSTCKDDNVFFRSEELIREAYKNNKAIAHKMLMC